MKSLAWATWIARVDMESLVSAMLRRGTLVSLGCIVLGWGGAWLGYGSLAAAHPLQGNNVWHLLQTSLPQAASPGAWPSVALRLGLAGLLITPYLRVVASLIYFVWVESNRRYALLYGLVVGILTYVLWFG